MNKKATISIETTIILARLILLALALLLPIALIQSFASLTIHTAPLQSTLLAYQIVMSPAGLGYFDPLTQQAPLGVIDAGRFETAVRNPRYLSSLSVNPRDQFGIKITIGSLSAYYNKQLYEDYIVLAHTRLPGQGGANRISFVTPVLLRSPSGDTPASAFIDVVIGR